MLDVDYDIGICSSLLGDLKVGVDEELDVLVVYVESLIWY